MIRIAPAAVLAVALLGGSSCGRTQEGGLPGSRIAGGETDRAPRERPVPSNSSDSVLSVRILPAIPRAGDRLLLAATGFSLDGGEIEWRVDGGPVPGEHADSFSTEALKKGTSVQARVTIGDREVRSDTVTLANTPPEVRSVRLVSDPVRPGDSFGVEAAGDDRDGDPVTFGYRWEKNGQPAGDGSVMEGTVRRGDSVSVTITPFDGEARGNFRVLRRDVRNCPPSIEGVIDAGLEDGVYACRVEATDGDGDPLAYALVEAPPGMTIDPGTGTVRWPVPDGFTGNASVTVRVADGHGGEASYPMSLTIREEPPGK